MNEEETINETSDNNRPETNWAVEADKAYQQGEEHFGAHRYNQAKECFQQAVEIQSTSMEGMYQAVHLRREYENAAQRLKERVMLAQEPWQEILDKKPERAHQVISQILAYLKPEKAIEAISLILAQLRPESASQIIQKLDLNVQLEVVKQIGCMESIIPEEHELFYACLKAAISSMPDVSIVRIGGPKLNAEILKRMDTNIEKQLMERLKQDDPGLAKEVREFMFVFNNLTYVDKRGIQKLVGTIGNDLNKISYALKAASDEVQGKFLEVVSEGARAEIESNMRDIPISLREALEAQQEILIAAAELIENGEIVVDGTGDAEDLLL